MKRAILFGLITALCSACLCMLLARRQKPEPVPQMKVEYAQVLPAPGYDEARMIDVIVEGVQTQMSLHEYLTGVLLGEMPASFSAEALKAQAVAARTFTLRILETGKHNGAICENASCCQAFVSAQHFLDENNGAGQPIIEEMAQAVADTDGLVLEYDGQLIDAVFFSCSGGRTEAAVEVWGGEIPYLQSVLSPGEEDAIPYTDEKQVSREEFCQTLEALNNAADFSGDDWVGSISYTQGGGIEQIVLGGVAFSGAQIRSAFALRSTMFSVEITDEAVTFHTKGFGHRVGMSQYGADAMAREGSSFAQILAYYYQGTELVALASQQSP